MNDRQKMFLKIFTLSLVSFAVACVIFFAGIMQGFELKAYDLFSRSLNPSLPSEDVIIIKIDQPSLESLSAEGINWPWPRQIYAPILEYRARADAIFMDIFFLEPSSYG